MNVLTFSTLFPNSRQPNFSVFIKQRMAAVKEKYNVDLRVVAPIPYYPFKTVGPSHWRNLAKVPQYESFEGIEVFHPRYLVTPKVGMIFYARSMYHFTLPLIKKLEAEKPFDLIDAHFIYPDGLAATMVGKALGKPVVISARGTDVNLYPSMPIIKPFVKRALFKATKLIAVCDSLKKEMMNLGTDKDKISVVPNGINKDVFYLKNKEQCRINIGLSENDKILLSVGALIERKGTHLLIDALNILKNTDKLFFKTYVVGEGEQRSYLEKMISKYDLQEKVFLVGEITNMELVDWYNSADLFFLGSSREGWPNVVSESLACGTPVVATSANGIPEIIISSDYGLIVDRTAEAFADSIYESISKEWNSEEIFNYGQSRDWSNVAEEVYRVFQTACNV